MSNMTEERIITVDEVQAAIDLEVAVLKKAIEMVVDTLGNMTTHMNAEFANMAEGIRETQSKHNKLALMFTAFVEAMGKLDCLQGD